MRLAGGAESKHLGAEAWVSWSRLWDEVVQEGQRHFADGGTISQGSLLRCELLFETRSREIMSPLPHGPQFQAFVTLGGTCRYQKLPSEVIELACVVYVENSVARFLHSLFEEEIFPFEIY